MLLRFTRYLTIVAALAFFGIGIYGRRLERQYLQYPTHPDPATQQVIPYNWKSGVIYMTHQQYALQRSVNWMYLVCVIAGSLHFVVREIVRQSKGK